MDAIVRYSTREQGAREKLTRNRHPPSPTDPTGFDCCNCGQWVCGLSPEGEIARLCSNCRAERVELKLIQRRIRA